MNSNDNDFRYLVPANVSTRFEFFPGFGWPELFWTLVAAAFSCSVFFLIGLLPFGEKPLAILFRVFIMIIIPAFTFMTFKPIDSTGISIAKRRRDIKKFRASQKQYLYISGK